ncbi:DNA-directed RNA polymerases I, II, and III subunit RPABC3 [Pseudocyphellaria aurata]|nr:DNA-directed RNA polymerases I, II, and III subunit RPABC3 [Pseudocyphellaria aurata]
MSRTDDSTVTLHSVQTAQATLRGRRSVSPQPIPRPSSVCGTSFALAAENIRHTQPWLMPNSFVDTFTVTSLDSHKYDRVSRLSSHSENGDTLLTLDVNPELFPCVVGERLHILLASTLSLDGSKDDGKGWKDIGSGESSLADEHDYVCHGKIYRFKVGG